MAEAILSVKKCRKCGAEFVGRCGSCKNAAAAVYRAFYPDKVKAATAAYRSKNQDKVRAANVARKIANKERNKAVRAIYLAANVEKVKAYKLVYREANRDKIKAYDAARADKTKTYYRANAERFKAASSARYAANPVKANARNDAWRKAHPEAKRAYGHNRSARKRGNGGRLSGDIVEKLFSLQRGKCACCGKSLGDKYDLDHIVSLARGGKNEDSNMQLLTSRCNRQKHTKDPIAFMQSRGFLL